MTDTHTTPTPESELVARLRALARAPGPQADGRAMLEAAATIERLHSARRDGIEMAAKVADKWAGDLDRAGAQFDKDGDIYRMCGVAEKIAIDIRALSSAPPWEVDQFIPLPDVQREAEKCRHMLDAGIGDTDPLYAAYNALLMVQMLWLKLSSC